MPARQRTMIRVRAIALSASLIALASFPAVSQQANAQANGAPAAPATPRPRFVLTSPAFQDSTPIPPKYTCSAGPVDPSIPLVWTAPRPGTVAFALLFHDLEANMHKTTEDVTHWMAWNIPADARGLPEGVPTVADLPDGTRQGINSPGKVGYFGPCPGKGLPHHYTFEIYALDQKLDLPATATRADFMNALQGHIVGHAVLVGLFNQ